MRKQRFRQATSRKLDKEAPLFFGASLPVDLMRLFCLLKGEIAIPSGSRAYMQVLLSSILQDDDTALENGAAAPPLDRLFNTTLRSDSC